MKPDEYKMLFAVREIPDVDIVDMRGYDYKGTLKKPNCKDCLDENIRLINARDFFVGLSCIDEKILHVKSREELITKLEYLFSLADTSADLMPINEERNVYCGIRDNIYQIVELLSK